MRWLIPVFLVVIGGCDASAMWERNYERLCGEGVEDIHAVTVDEDGIAWWGADETVVDMFGLVDRPSDGSLVPCELPADVDFTVPANKAVVWFARCPYGRSCLDTGSLTVGQPGPNVDCAVAPGHDYFAEVVARFVDDNLQAAECDRYAERSYTAVIRLDTDGDGFGLSDCDDDNPTVHPGADETCNDIDDDCNGIVDDNPVDELTWYRDTDGDGFGDESSTTLSCTKPFGFVRNASDCDDTDADIHPGAPMRDNGEDNDCDGNVDVSTYFEPYAFFVGGVFAYDKGEGTTVPWEDEDGVTHNPTMSLVFATSEYFDSGDISEICTMMLSLDSPEQPLATVSFDDSTTGTDQSMSHDMLEFPAHNVSVNTDCVNWDPGVWGSDPVAAIQDWQWWVGFGNIRSDVHEFITDSAPDYADLVLGGSVKSDLFSSESGVCCSAGAFTRAFEFDAATRTPNADGGGERIPIYAEVFEDGNRTPTALYSIEPFSGYYAEFLLP